MLVRVLDQLLSKGIVACLVDDAQVVHCDISGYNIMLPLQPDTNLIDADAKGQSEYGLIGLSLATILGEVVCPHVYDYDCRKLTTNRMRWRDQPPSHAPVHMWSRCVFMNVFPHYSTGVSPQGTPPAIERAYSSHAGSRRMPFLARH